MDKETSLARDSLLPSGFSDVLFPQGGHLHHEMSLLVNSFQEHGYRYIDAPLLEFEENYLKAANYSLQDQCFRMMDPQSKKMMVVRPDMTPQVARIASTRLSREERPLRLCYSGTCITVVPVSAEETRRQIVQTGLELIGPDSAHADVEVLQIGAQALRAIGIEDVSFDLTMPQFVPRWLDEKKIPKEEQEQLLKALESKDISTISNWGNACRPHLLSLLDASGDEQRALSILDGLKLPQKSARIYQRFKQTIMQLRRICPDLRITIDLADFKGWRYHTGVCVALFSGNYAQELGRGGRYLCQNGEPAFGLTLRPDVLLPMSHIVSH